MLFVCNLLIQGSTFVQYRIVVVATRRRGTEKEGESARQWHCGILSASSASSSPACCSISPSWTVIEWDQETRRDKQGPASLLPSFPSSPFATIHQYGSSVWHLSVQGNAIQYGQCPVLLLFPLLLSLLSALPSSSQNSAP